MVRIEKIDSSMFSQAYELLLDLRDTYLTADDWKNIFDYNWDREEDYCGYGLFDGNNLVGFLGLIFSKRLVGDRIEHFCNLTSWIVRPEYKIYSLSLIQPILKLKKYNLTDLTPSRAVYRIEKRLGFSELDSRMNMLLPYEVFKKSNRANKFCCTNDKRLVEKELNDRELKLFHDHRRYECGHVIAYDNNNYCYILYTRVKNSRIPYCYIQHISNLDMFSKYSGPIRFEIAKAGKTPFILVDSRLVQEALLPFSFSLPFRAPKLYKSASLRPEQIDNLYSEAVLLNLSTIPNIKRIKQDLLTYLFGEGPGCCDKQGL
jgi:hypothetical protein